MSAKSRRTTRRTTAPKAPKVTAPVVDLTPVRFIPAPDLTAWLAAYEATTVTPYGSMEALRATITPAPVEDTYPARIRAAVKFARYELHAHRPTRKPDERPAAASKGDHVAVRNEILNRSVPDEITVEEIARVFGVARIEILAEIARFVPGSTTDTGHLREIGATFTGQKNAAWRQGRYLAGIAVAFAAEVSTR